MQVSWFDMTNTNGRGLLIFFSFLFMSHEMRVRKELGVLKKTGEQRVTREV